MSDETNKTLNNFIFVKCNVNQDDSRKEFRKGPPRIFCLWKG